MFEDLNWKYAARRAAVVIAIYLGLLYLLSRLFPESNFRLDNREQILSLVVNAVLFFFIFTFVYAYIDRTRRRRMAEMGTKNKAAKTAGTGEETESQLKGRPNPNTSRKKARRKR